MLITIGLDTPHPTGRHSVTILAHQRLGLGNHSTKGRLLENRHKIANSRLTGQRDAVITDVIVIKFYKKFNFEHTNSPPISKLRHIDMVIIVVASGM